MFATISVYCIVLFAETVTISIIAFQSCMFFA